MIVKGRYKANFSKGGLMVPESRIVADLLLRGADQERWRQAVLVDNVLRKRSPTTALTKAILIRTRLRTMTAELWGLVRDGSKPVATHAVLAATVKYSPLIGDFLDLTIRELYRRFEERLEPRHWDAYLEDCRNRDPAMPNWAPATMRTLQTRVVGMLAEAGYLADARSRVLKPLRIAPEVLGYLRAAEEFYVLRCLEVSP